MQLVLPTLYCQCEGVQRPRHEVTRSRGLRQGEAPVHCFRQCFYIDVVFDHSILLACGSRAVCELARLSTCDKGRSKRKSSCLSSPFEGKPRFSRGSRVNALSLLHVLRGGSLVVLVLFIVSKVARAGALWTQMRAGEAKKPAAMVRVLCECRCHTRSSSPRVTIPGSHSLSLPIQSTQSI